MSINLPNNNQSASPAIFRTPFEFPFVWARGQCVRHWHRTCHICNLDQSVAANCLREFRWSHLEWLAVAGLEKEKKKGNILIMKIYLKTSVSLYVHYTIHEMCHRIMDIMKTEWIAHLLSKTIHDYEKMWYIGGSVLNQMNLHI